MEVQNRRRRSLQAALGYEKVFGPSLIDCCLVETKMVQLGPMLEVQALAVSCVLRDYRWLKTYEQIYDVPLLTFSQKSFQLYISMTSHFWEWTRSFERLGVRAP